MSALNLLMFFLFLLLLLLFFVVIVNRQICFKSRRHIYLVMEYCAGGDMHKFIRRWVKIRTQCQLYDSWLDTNITCTPERVPCHFIFSGTANCQKATPNTSCDSWRRVYISCGRTEDTILVCAQYFRLT